MLIDSKEKKYQQLLYYSGQAFIVFGLWSIVKIVLQAYLNPVDLASMDMLEDVSKQTLQTVAYCVMAVFLLADILIRLYIGLSAIKEAKGKHKSMVYLIVAAVYILLTLVAFIPHEYDTNYEDENSFATVFFDATNAIALLVIIINSWKLRKLKR